MSEARLLVRVSVLLHAVLCVLVSGLTLAVGWQEEHLECKITVPLIFRGTLQEQVVFVCGRYVKWL